jgi:hypothetical protein
MLENAERDGYAHLISWLPDGKSFKIHAERSLNGSDEQNLVDILKKHFNQTRFKSFLRQLQLYGFERTYKGPHKGVCKHEFFVRGRKDLIHKKSIDAFQRKANDSSKISPKNLRAIFEPPRPSEVVGSSPFPMSTPSGCFGQNGCSYFETSVIPTKLYNLVLPESDNSVKESQDDDESLAMNMPVMPEQEFDDDVISIHSGENVPSWTTKQVHMLQCAL